MNWPALLYLVATFATIFCTAVNCYTLRLAYPLWRLVPAGDFGQLHAAYLRWLGPVITFPHIVMFFASAGLMRWRPLWFSFTESVWLFVLDSGVVAVSAFWAGPIHSRFERVGVWDERGLSTLVRISALRSLMMCAASGLVLFGLWKALRGLR